MPRTVPAQITAAATNLGRLAWVWLVEIHLPSGGGSFYYSSAEAVTFNGNSYIANRVKSISGLTGMYIDGLNKEFGNSTVVLSGLSDDGSTNFPFTALEGSVNPDGGKLYVHGFDTLSGTGLNLWSGYIKGRTYNDDTHSATIEASFFWDSPTATVPSSTLQQEGFGTLDTNTVKQTLVDDVVIPIVIGAGQFKVRPNLYFTLTLGDTFRVNGVLSGTRKGLPFNINDIVNMKLFDVTPPKAPPNFHIGKDTDDVPHNSNVFPDLSGHNNIAYFSADFPINADNKDQLDNINVDDIKVLLANGRPVKSTGLPTQNAVLALVDVLTDELFGLGLDPSDFDDYTAAENASATMWQCRVELHETKGLADWVQGVLLQTSMFMTFNNGKMQIQQKSQGESSVATFATTRSGQVGGKIVNDKVVTTFKGSDDLDNQVNVTFRLPNRHQKEIIAYDNTAQASNAATGGKARKVNKQDYDFDIHTDYTQTSIAAAMLVREQQSANMYIEFSTSIAEGIYPSPGDLITVWSEDIPNNAGNNKFRIISQPFDMNGPIPMVTIRAQVYKSDVYAYSTSGIGIDEIRGGSDTSSQGRPPDVIPVNLIRGDKETSDTGGVLENITANWTYPSVDLSGDATAGVTHEYPIHSVQLWWRYTNESVNHWKLGVEVLYPATTASFPVDFHKTMSIEVMFVALSLSRSHGPFGYVEDATKTTSLTANTTATGVTFNVVDTTAFTVNDFVRCEFEILKLASKTSNTLTFVSSGGNRTPFFDSVSIAHPQNIQVAVAKQNYPTLQIALTGPKFTYPAVTSINALQREDGIKIKIQSPQAQNIAFYLCYMSLTGDPGGGTDHPSWLLTDPFNPPVGITITQHNAVHFTIPQEDIGPAGTQAFFRIIASNGRNYSGDGAGNPKMSNLSSNRVGDDAVPVVTSAPRVVLKGVGIHAVVIDPITNVKTLSNRQIVIRAKNGATTLGYLQDTGGVFSSSATEYKFDLGKAQFHNFGLQKEDVLAIWSNVLTLEVYDYIINAVGSSAASPINTINVSTWSVIGATPPTAIAFPSAPSSGNNTVDGDPETALARIIITLATVSGTFSANNVSTVDIVVTLLDPNTGLVTGKPFTEVKTLSATDLGNASCDHQFYHKMGKRVRITEVVARNGDKKTSTTGTSDFWTGGTRTVLPTDSITVPAPTFGTITQESGNNKIDLVPITITQNGTDIILFKRLLLEISIGGGSFQFEKDVALKTRDTLYTSVSSSYTETIRAKRKAGATVQYRATVYAVGGKASSSTLSSSNAATAGDVLANAAAPSGLSTPIVRRLKPSGLKGDLTIPTTDNFNCVADIYIANGAHGLATLWLSSDMTNSTTLEGQAPIRVAATGDFLIPCTKENLLPIFPSGIITIYATWTNDKGTSAFSSAVTYNLATGDTGPITRDVGVPTVSAPNFVVDGKLMKIQAPAPSNAKGWQSSAVVVVVNTSGGGFLGYLGISGTSWVLSGSEQRINIGQSGEYALNIKKAKILSLAPTAGQLQAYQYAISLEGTSNASPSATLDLSLYLDHLSSGDSVNNVAVAITMNPTLNIIPNSDCLGDSGISGTLNRFLVWDGAGNPANGAHETVITTIAAAGARWNQTDHAIEINNSGTAVKIIANLKHRFVAGDKLYFSIQARTLSGTLAGGSMVVKLLKASNPTVENQEVAINQSLLSVATTYVVVGGNLRIKASPDFNDGSGNYVDQWLDVELTVPNGSTLEVDRFYCKRGEQPGGWEPSPSESDTPPLGTGVVPTTTISNPDLGTPSGSQGGWVIGSGSSRILGPNLE